MCRSRLITFPSFHDSRGTLSVMEWGSALPFPPKRFYYIYNHTDGARRGGHAHLAEQELILALTGQFTVWLDDGGTRTAYRLDRPDQALHIPPLVWHEVDGFSADAVCAVFASSECNNGDYIRDYQEFLKARGERSGAGKSAADPLP